MRKYNFDFVSVIWGVGLFAAMFFALMSVILLVLTSVKWAAAGTFMASMTGSYFIIKRLNNK